MREVSSTFALSTESSRPLRPRASSNARRARRSTWRGWYSQRVEDGAVVAHAARAVVEAADELAHDQQVDARRPTPGAGSRRRRARCAGRSGPASGRTAEPSHFGPPTAPSSTASAVAAGGERLRGQRVADRVDRGAAERVLLDREVERQRLEHADGLGHHLGPDPVAGQADDAATSPCELLPGQVEHVAGRARRARRRTAARRSRPASRASSASSRPGSTQRDPVRAACARAARRTISSRRLTAASSARSTASISSRRSSRPGRSRRHSQLLEQRVDVGVDLDDRGRCASAELRRLQAGAGDEHDDAVVLAELAARDGLAQRADGDAGRALAEDAGVSRRAARCSAPTSSSGTA